MTRDEWRALPTIAPYSWEIRRDDVVLRAEIVVGSDIEEPFAFLPSPPYTLVGTPHRAELPEITVDLNPGDEPIWFKCRKQVYGVDNGGQLLEPIIFEYPVIGRRDPTGKEYVCVVFPDGETAVFDSVKLAVS